MHFRFYFFSLFDYFISLYFSGLLRDVSGSYAVSLFGAACAMVLSVILFYVSLILSNRAKAEELSKRSVSVFTVTRF